MFFIFLLLALVGLALVAVFWRKSIAQIADAQTRQCRSWATILCLTFAYWGWESVTGGNIRVDLLLFYPVLVAAYIMFLWDSLKWRSLLVVALLMAANIAYMIISYPLLGKVSG